MPRQTIVFKPSTASFFSARRELFPHLVYFFLRLAPYPKRYGLGKLELRSTVECDKFSSIELKSPGHDHPPGSRPCFSVSNNVCDL